LVRVGSIRQQLASRFGDNQHVFVLHSEASWDVDQRLDRDDHPRLERLVAVAAEIRLFVQRETDAVADEADRLEAERAEAFQTPAIDLFAGCPGLDHVHDEIFALDQILPDLLLLGRCTLDGSGAADAGEIAVFLPEYLHADEIAGFQGTRGRPDVRKLAALAG